MENVVGLSGLGAATEVAIDTSSARVALPANARAISIVAVGASASFKLGDASVTAADTDHHIVSGTRMDILIRDGQTHIAAVQDDPSGTGKLRISALVNAWTVANERSSANYGEPVNTVAPVVTGSTDPNSTLTCDTGSWRGNTPITFSYQWLANDVVIPGATSSAFSNTLDGVTYKARVSARNVRGEASGVTSAGTTIADPGPQ